MANVFGQPPWTAPGDAARPPKRISTPAGDRLSAIMNEKYAHSSTAPVPAFTTPPVEELDQGDEDFIDSQPNSAKTTSTPLAYAPSAYSDKAIYTQQSPPDEQKPSQRLFAAISRRRLVVLLGLVIAVLLALVIGLAVGLTRSSKDKSSTSALSPDQSSSPVPSGTSPSASVTATSTPAVSLPTGFPVGTYSMYTFLDTVNTNCTTDAASWTCAPGIVYNDSPDEAEATFFFNISGPAGAYQIESSVSTGIMAGLDLLPHDLQLLDAGQDDERYMFQTSYYKNVSTTLNGTDAVCSFPSTTFTGYLFTKYPKTYPLPGQTLPPTSNALWPFRMTFEADNGGGAGAGVSCVNENNGEPIDGVQAQAFGQICSCFYRNWRPSIAS